MCRISYIVCLFENDAVSKLEIENRWDVGSKNLNLFPIDILQFTIMAGSFGRYLVWIPDTTVLYYANTPNE